MCGDPFEDELDRSEYHHAERLLLENFIEHYNRQLKLLEVVASVPGGPFADACSRSVITSLPQGTLIDTHLPSTLDYGAASDDLVRSSELHWECAPADHTVVCYECSSKFVFRKLPKTT